MSIASIQSNLNPSDAYIVISPENRRYLTGFASSDGYLLITKTSSVFFTDSRYIEAAENQITSCSDIVLLTSLSKQLPEYLEKNNITVLYTEADRLSLTEFEKIKKTVSCVCVADYVDEKIDALRRVKSETEKKKILMAQAIAEKAFDNVLSFIKEGVTEREIALTLDFFMLRNGAEAYSIETIAVSGRNNSLTNGVPTEKKIEKGDFITMDFGAVVDGYHSDMTRTVAVGEISSKQAEVYETVLRAQESSLKILKSGVSCIDADAAARDIIKDAGYGKFFGHGTGHGVGIEIHEAPRLSPSCDKILQIGDVVTVEPGIYLPSEFGVRIEDMAFITENGCENLTKSPKNLIIL